jgi:hypothetical protein
MIFVAVRVTLWYVSLFLVATCGQSDRITSQNIMRALILLSVLDLSIAFSSFGNIAPIQAILASSTVGQLDKLQLGRWIIGRMLSKSEKKQSMLRWTR